MFITKCDQLLLVIRNMLARAQQQPAVVENATQLSHDRFKIFRMVQHLARVNRVKSVIRKGKFLGRLLDHSDRKPAVLRQRADRARADLFARVWFQGGHMPSVLCQRITRDAVAGAQIKNLLPTACAQQPQNFRELFAVRIALCRLKHGQIEIIVPNFSFIARLVAIPANGLFPGYPAHSTLRSSSVNGLIIRAGLPAAIVQSGTSLVTTLPAPTTAPSPILTPFRIIARAPIQALLPILTGTIGTRDQSFRPWIHSRTSLLRSAKQSE